MRDWRRKKEIKEADSEKRKGKNEREDGKGYIKNKVPVQFAKMQLANR
jgi:hypothetical protein